VVGQIIPWNFPLLMAAWKLGPGARDRLHGRAQAGRADPAERAPPRRADAGGGMPTASSTSSPASARPPAPRCRGHPGVDKVAFTGSTEVGKLIVEAAANDLKRVTLELGGKSPNVVFADADLETAIPGAANAIFFNHGQCCCAGSRLYIEQKVYDEVLAGRVRPREQDQARARARARHRDGPARLGRAARARDRIPRVRRARGRAHGHGRQAGRRPRLLRRADRARRRRPRATTRSTTRRSSVPS
jgi:hypothetical protein